MIRLQIKHYLFAPKTIPFITALFVIPILVSLGLWQLDRAEEKRGVDNTVKEAQAKAPLDIISFAGNDFSKELYRRASLTGNYDTQHQFLLDNRTHKGVAGYHVLTPFYLKGSNNRKGILINRGWITYQGTRDNIPDIHVKDRDITITGVIKKQGRAIVLQENQATDTRSDEIYPRLVQSIQLSELAKELNVELLPIVIELDTTDSTGFTREWQPYYGSIDKHNAYALQWFAMAGIVFFLLLKLNTKKIRL